MDGIIKLIRDFSEVHIALAPLLYIVTRTLSVVFPPFPGTALDLLAIPLFGKLWGFIYAEITMILGASIDFFIARKFGRPFVEKFISLEKIEEYEIKISEKAGFAGLTAIRMITIAVYDYMSYIAGLTRMRFGKFFLASLVASAPPTALFFYVGGFILNWNLGALTFLIPVILFIIFIRDKIITKKMKSRFNNLVNGKKEQKK